MAPAGTPTPATNWTKRLDDLGRTRPDIVLMAPYMAYLLLLGLVGLVPPSWEWVATIIRGVGSLTVVWVLRKHLPAWGRPHWLLAIAAGIFAAWLWYVGQYVFNDIGLGGRLPVFPGEKSVEDPRDVLGAHTLFRATVALRILVAITAVPIVEELFWRAFMLRALINWQEFERVPIGRFTWFSFIGTSLLSTLQHPDNWGVSIFCWLLFNGLFYWKRSILFLVIVHAVTNLVLYIHVIHVGDWQFW
ncbi:MAG: CAAX prenyl protease-related protein [Phycisphaerae bacterium]